MAANIAQTGDLIPGIAKQHKIATEHPGLHGFFGDFSARYSYIPVVYDHLTLNVLVAVNNGLQINPRLRLKAKQMSVVLLVGERR